MKYIVRCLTFSALITIYAFAESPGDSVKPIHGAEFAAGTALGIGMFFGMRELIVEDYDISEGAVSHNEDDIIPGFVGAYVGFVTGGAVGIIPVGD